MPSDSTQDLAKVATTALLAAGLLMEDTSASLALQSHPSWPLLAERVQLLEDTAQQLQALAMAARAALERKR